MPQSQAGSRAWGRNRHTRVTRGQWRGTREPSAPLIRATSKWGSTVGGDRDAPSRGSRPQDAWRPLGAAPPLKPVPVVLVTPESNTKRLLETNAVQHVFQFREIRSLSRKQNQGSKPVRKRWSVEHARDLEDTVRIHDGFLRAFSSFRSQVRFVFHLRRSSTRGNLTQITHELNCHST